MVKPGKIIISRTDSIGDVLLTLPVAGIIKEKFPECKIIFLGSSYTGDIVEACCHVDEFADWDLVKNRSSQAKKEFLKDLQADMIIHVFPNKTIASAAHSARIRVRTGTTNRIFHWLTCNHLIRLSRKNSDLHEAQLNLKLLDFNDLIRDYTLQEIPEYYGLTKIKSIKNEFASLIRADRFNLIIHPTSKGSAREWTIENYGRLIELLPADKLQIFITGTEADKVRTNQLVNQYPFLIDLTGKMKLDEFLGFISHTQGLLAASTGPLHMAAALGKFALGLYPSVRPVNAARWAPLGKKAAFIEDNRLTGDQSPTLNISPEQVLEKLIDMTGNFSQR